MVVWALEACFASSCCILQECSRFAFEHSHSSQCDVGCISLLEENLEKKVELFKVPCMEMGGRLL